MIVELRSAGTRNKGAELMLRAVARELERDHEVAIEPSLASYDERARMGLLQKVAHRKAPRQAVAAGARGLPGKLRRHLIRQYGLVFEPDLGALLDASGFAYTDQFDLQRHLVAADLAERCRAAGKPYVLLPQAFGPFTEPQRRAAFVRLANAATLVFARERVSFEHVLASGCRTDHVSLSPDFTCLLDGELPEGFDTPERQALVVPSMKLLTETGPEVRDAYVPFMAGAVEVLRDRGLDVRILVHELGDDAVVDQVQAALAEPAPVIRHRSALHLKGVIGAAEVVVGSRFHALVSALSQGVPAIGVGWSHKYEMLFDDYGCRERVVDPAIGRDGLASHVDALTGPGHAELVETLLAAAAEERTRAHAMWASVRRALG